jgi:hypothetical protein
MCKRILGRKRDTKITNTELNWLYSALIARQPIDPTHLIGVLPLHVGYLFKTGYYKEPEASPTQTSLRFEERKIYK